MKRYYVDILQIAAGTVVGTALVIGYLWSMLGGVFLILPIWVLIGLFVLFWVSVLAAGLKVGYKGIVAVMASFVLGWFGFNALYKHTCGPNAKDVKVMKPMAEKISAYIVKHGIPERLEEIPDLPYRLEGCERKVEYSKLNQETLKPEIVSRPSKADFYQINEICNFKYQNRTYYLELSKGISIPIKEGNRGGIDIGNKESQTWAGLNFSAIDNSAKAIITHGFSFGSSKNDGICNPMRQ